jgi:hypothetical protein
VGPPRAAPNNDSRTTTLRLRAEAARAKSAAAGADSPAPSRSQATRGPARPASELLIPAHARVRTTPARIVAWYRREQRICAGQDRTTLGMIIILRSRVDSGTTIGSVRSEVNPSSPDGSPANGDVDPHCRGSLPSPGGDLALRCIRAAPRDTVQEPTSRETPRKTAVRPGWCTLQRWPHSRVKYGGWHR